MFVPYVYYLNMKYSMEGKNSKDSSTKSLNSPQSGLVRGTPSMSELSDLMDDCLMESDICIEQIDPLQLALHQ